jgi:hypothetical protein
MPGAEDAVIGVYENSPYLALHSVAEDPDTGGIPTDKIRVMRWRKGSWQSLPNPGNGTGRPALDFTPSGRPVVAYLELLEEGQTLNILVKYWTGGKAWRSVGDKVATVSCGPKCYPKALLDLSLDARGRPIVAWGERSYTQAPDGTYTPVSSLKVRRYSDVLP